MPRLVGKRGQRASGKLLDKTLEWVGAYEQPKAFLGRLSG
jgi:hypothetical protein